MMVVEYGDDIIIIDAGVMFPDEEMFRVNHSIPDAVGVVIHTPIGSVVHTGDYKFDYTPTSGRPADLGSIGRIGNECDLLMMGDSTRVESAGFTPSESVINDSFDKLFANAPGRILIATFASLLSRVQLVIDTAVRYERQVALVGRSMVNNVQMAIELGYLNVPKATLIRAEDINKFPPERVVLICTGSQGEPTSALTRIANQDHRLVRIQSGDTVILSATPVPGNEKMVNRTINTLFKQGAEVFYQGIATVHVSGHAAQEELKLMLAMVHPQFFMPIHGEYRQLVLHAKLAHSMGIPADHIIVAEDGDGVEVTPQGVKVVNHTPCGNVFVDGLGVGDVGQVVMRDRQVLAQDGILLAVLTVDKETGQPLAGPDIISRGFVYMRDAEELLESARERILESFIGLNGHSSDWSFVKDKNKNTLSEFLYEKTHRRPMILPVVMEV